MKVLVCKRFEKRYDKIVKGLISIKEFSKELAKSIEKNPIFLKRPYGKMKIKIGNIHLRGVYKYFQEKITIIPIIIEKKSNKKGGYNIIWDNDTEKKIKFEMGKINEDIEKGYYELYDFE